MKDYLQYIFMVICFFYYWLVEIQYTGLTLLQSADQNNALKKITSTKTNFARFEIQVGL